MLFVNYLSSFELNWTLAVHVC